MIESDKLDSRFWDHFLAASGPSRGPEENRIGALVIAPSRTRW